MDVYAKMKRICDNIRLRTGGTELLNLDDIAQAVLSISGDDDLTAWINSAVATTFPPTQLPASPDIEGYDIDILNATADDIYAYIDEGVSGKTTVTKEILGKDASGKYDMARYIFANRKYLAWQKENYPKMYAWENGSTVRYTESVSPRVGDKAYNTPYIEEGGTTTETIVVPAQAALVEKTRWSGSGKTFSVSTPNSTLFVPVKGKAVPFDITLVNMTVSNDYPNVYGGSPTPTDSTVYGTASTNSTTVKVTKAVDCVVFMVNRTNTAGATTEYDNAKILIGDEEIGIAISTQSNYTSNVKQKSTTTVEVESENSKPITQVKTATVASGATTNTIPSSRIIDGLEYVRAEEYDVEPTVIYTEYGDTRNSNESITQDGITYHRYPLGDLGANREKLIPIFIYANEHGTQPDRISNTENAMYQKYETKMCALVAARFLLDLAEEKQLNEPFYQYIHKKCMVVVIPVANPYGYNMNVTGDTNVSKDGYYNANNVNTNRNFDTPGWVISYDSVHHGAYPGSENETQYLMNTMVESGAKVAMSLHGIGGFFYTSGEPPYGICAHQGQNPDGSHYDKNVMKKISDFLYENYGYVMVFYDRREEDHKHDFEPPTGESINLPDRACKSPSYITQCGAYGGIIEFQPDDIHISGYQQTYKGYIIENAYAQFINLTALWLSQYISQ